MSVKIRFSRIGKKNAPFYRIVAIDSQSKRDGEPLEILGTYNPLTGQIIQFHAERVKARIAQGAIISDAVHKIYKRHQKSTESAAS